VLGLGTAKRKGTDVLVSPGGCQKEGLSSSTAKQGFGDKDSVVKKTLKGVDTLKKRGRRDAGGPRSKVKFMSAWQPFGYKY